MKLIIKTFKEEGWLKEYKDGFVRSHMDAADIQVLQDALSPRRIKYIDGDYLVIEDEYDNKISALRVLAKIQKLQKNLSNTGFEVTVDVVE